MLASTGPEASQNEKLGGLAPAPCQADHAYVELHTPFSYMRDAFQGIYRFPSVKYHIENSMPRCVSINSKHSLI